MPSQLHCFISVVSSHSRQQFCSSDKPTVLIQLVNIAEHLVAEEPQVSLIMGLVATKTELKENEYWTYIHHVARNMTSHQCSMSSGCVDRQLFPKMFERYFIKY